ncbi:MAG: outer membrane beta-barrel protein [Legionellaceae bacterium]|nr:outer membrane beta-barrel protein [Legionellaceae bacterium]
MRTRIYLVGIGLLSSTAFAGTMGPVVIAEPYNGFYIGGDIGVANLADKESTLYAPGQYDRHQFSSTGFVGGGMIGYDYGVIDRLKLGVEGFMNGTALNSAAEQKYGTQPSFNANMRYNAGVRLLPGYEFSPSTVGHVLLGYSYGKFNLKDTGNYGLIDTGLSRNGFQAGLGLKVPCHFKNLSLRGDVIYTTYGSSTSLGQSVTLAPQNYNNSFSTIEGNLSLVYKFL